MPIVIPIDEMQVSFHMRYVDIAAGECVCTLGIDSSSSTATHQANLETVSNAWVSNIMPTMHTGVAYTEATALRAISGGHEALTTGVLASAGSAGGDMLPASVAALVQKRTGLAGKRFRGRMYLPGQTSNQVLSGGGNFMSATHMAAIGTAFDNFDAAIRAADLVPVLFHPAPATTSTPITEWIPQQRWATQRGRLRD